MELSDILSADAVVSKLNATSKKRLLQEIARVADEVYGLPCTEIFAALQDRELLGATGVGNGVAIPHARLACLDDVKGVFVRLEHPVDYESVDSQPVNLIFALLAPEGAGAMHLKSLARVSRTLRDATVCAKLRSSKDANALFAILTAIQPSKAA
ncbi:MAG: PTS IIA-like nitrogen regulatory protein PtsN [Paracoccaceae bacterium]